MVQSKTLNIIHHVIMDQWPATEYLAEPVQDNWGTIITFRCAWLEVDSFCGRVFIWQTIDLFIDAIIVCNQAAVSAIHF